MTNSLVSTLQIRFSWNTAMLIAYVFICGGDVSEWHRWVAVTEPSGPRVEQYLLLCPLQREPVIHDLGDKARRVGSTP